jgi:hypothetical protein
MIIWLSVSITSWLTAKFKLCHASTLMVAADVTA